MSHHFDSPTAIADGRLNLCDVYAFAGGFGSTVLVLTVNPDAGRSSPVTLRPDAVYEFAIDTRGGTEQDLALRVRFEEPDADGRQEFTVLVARAGRLADAGAGELVGGGVTGTATRLSFDGSVTGKVWAGLAADPFWANGGALFAFLEAVRDGRYAPEVFDEAFNVFEGRNVTALVLRIPDRLLGHGRSSVWATVTLYGHAPARQVSRMGQPMLRPLFFNVPGQDSEDLNAGDPAADRQEHGTRVTALAAELASVAGHPDAQHHAADVAAAFLPDVLGYTAGEPVRFRPGGSTGRALDDDAFGSALSFALGRPIAMSASPRAAEPTFPHVHAPDLRDLPALADLFGLRPAGADPLSAPDVA